MDRIDNTHLPTHPHPYQKNQLKHCQCPQWKGDYCKIWTRKNLLKSTFLNFFCDNSCGPFTHPLDFFYSQSPLDNIIFLYFYQVYCNIFKKEHHWSHYRMKCLVIHKHLLEITHAMTRERWKLTKFVFPANGIFLPRLHKEHCSSQITEIECLF